ncbi:hypothetical protein ACS0TY_017437 [Phlomoides rotata]
MAGRRELAFPKPSVANLEEEKMSLKEKMVMATLRNVRSLGHPYVELRQDGKKLIFFCTLCLAPCYGDINLWNHLKGHLHTERLDLAKATLLKPNPWPFNDGVFLFHDTEEQGSEKDKLLDIHHADAESLALVKYAGNLEPSGSTHTSQELEDSAEGNGNPCDSNMDADRTDRQLVIPAVLQNDVVSDLVVRHMGVGKISARFMIKDGDSDEIHKIWCEWLGDEDFTSKNTDVVVKHDFAVVTFAYNYNLGRRGLLSGFRYLLPSSRHLETEDSGSPRGRKRKSFSEPEISNEEDTSGEESRSSNCNTVALGIDDQQLYSQIFSSKTMRKQWKKQMRIASGRTCAICRQKMLPNKDVAALMNTRTGKLVCSSRNSTGAFHMFHMSCLIHWILLCEVETYAKQSNEPKAKSGSTGKGKGKNGKKGKKHKLQEKPTRSVFCPECQGTGVRIDGNVEIPTIPLSEIFRCKIKLHDAHKEWMKRPELLQNCSMGFVFPPISDEKFQEYVAPLKMLHFYRADD